MVQISRLWPFLKHEISLDPSVFCAFRGDVFRSLAEGKGWLSHASHLESYLAWRWRRWSTKVRRGVASLQEKRIKRARREDVCSSYVRLFDSLESAARESRYYIEGGSPSERGGSSLALSSSFSSSSFRGATYRFLIVDKVCAPHSRYRT